MYQEDERLSEGQVGKMPVHLRHPVGRADHGVTLGAFGGDLSAEAKVGEFDVAVHSEENVVRFDVAVNDVFTVQELERLKHL